MVNQRRQRHRPLSARPDQCGTGDQLRRGAGMRDADPGLRARLSS
jgi:hypothetical protein